MIDFSGLIAKPLVKFVLLPLLIAAGAAFYKYCPWINQDNPVEENIEFFIKDKLDEDIDLSPSSKEAHK